VAERERVEIIEIVLEDQALALICGECGECGE
jgi:hypothetical protein